MGLDLCFVGVMRMQLMDVLVLIESRPRQQQQHPGKCAGNMSATSRAVASNGRRGINIDRVGRIFSQNMRPIDDGGLIALLHNTFTGAVTGGGGGS